jgi:FtsP/CotA-like multicopper oxidase with cupredoxin domain
MSISRRDALLSGATALASAAALRGARTAEAAQTGASSREWEASYSGTGKEAPPGEPGKDYTPVVTPNGETLPFKIVEGVKVFHLVAEEVRHEFAPGLTASCWGYNGRVHGPTLEAVEGDRVRVYVTNKLPEPTTVHWHAVFLPNGMDGVGGLTQKVIRPGETFKYEWTFRQHGTLMYHSHHDEMTQMAMGMMGMIVVHPRRPAPEYKVDRDWCILLSEWSIKPGMTRPNPAEMTEFNVLTMNAKVYPATAPLVCRKGDRIRIRLGNLSAMDHHSIHVHGHFFKVVATDGGTIPASARWPETTVIVPTGSTRDIELVADAPGDWAIHCHMTHHVMTQMGHGVPNTIGLDAGKVDPKVQKLIPGYMTMGQGGMGDMAAMKMDVPKNSIPMAGGQGPFDPITMGGMFTILKVRENLADRSVDPGWFKAPAGTLATVATAEDLARDGIRVKP